MVNMKELDSKQADFWAALQCLIAWEGLSGHSVTEVVSDILHHVKTRGDQALLEYTQRFDHLTISTADALKIPKQRLQRAWDNISTEQRQHLDIAKQRIRVS